jgi:hypothetical protein
MKRVLLSLGLSVLSFVVVPNLVLAGPHDQVRFALHVKPKFTSSKAIPTLCAYGPTGVTKTECLNYNVTTSSNLFPGNHVFLVVGQAGTVGITGASCGVDYDGRSGDGIDTAFVTFDYCIDGIQFPNNGGEGDFPKPRGGLRVTWSTCQAGVIGGSGVHATIGAFYTYAYAPDILRLTPNNNLQSGPELAVTQCGGGTTDLLQVLGPMAGGALAKVHYSNGPGYNPCGVVPTVPTTWGNLKNLYRTGN